MLHFPKTSSKVTINLAKKQENYGKCLLKNAGLFACPAWLEFEFVLEFSIN